MPKAPLGVSLMNIRLSMLLSNRQRFWKHLWLMGGYLLRVHSIVIYGLINKNDAKVCDR